MESDSVMEENRTPLGLLTPSQQNGEIAASLDFYKLTPSQFGITTNSFTAFPKDKDKSRVSQLKSRRRSTIGVRGSPETNSLICFRAKQAMKTPPRTPQHLLDTPLFSGRDSIKQKMAAFRRLMETEEEEERVRHVQSADDDDDDDGGEERENRLAPLTPPLSKRRRRGTPHRSVMEEKTPSELTRSPEHTPQRRTRSKKIGIIPSISPATRSSGEGVISTGVVIGAGGSGRVRVQKIGDGTESGFGFGLAVSAHVFPHAVEARAD
ncbi:cell division cycle-associated protein 2 isoform X1 [Tachysurus ichikawai]